MLPFDTIDYEDVLQQQAGLAIEARQIGAYRRLHVALRAHMLCACVRQWLCDSEDFARPHAHLRRTGHFRPALVLCRMHVTTPGWASAAEPGRLYVLLGRGCGQITSLAPTWHHVCVCVLLLLHAHVRAL